MNFAIIVETPQTANRKDWVNAFKIKGDFMKRLLCFVICVTHLVCLCGCKNSTDTSSQSSAEIIVEEIVEMQGNNNGHSQNTTENIVKNPFNTESGSSIENSVGNVSSAVDNYGTQNSTNTESASSPQANHTQSNNSADDVSSEADKNSNITTNTSSTVGNDSTYDSNAYKLNDAEVLKNIKLNGRCEKTSDGISLGMSASAIEFNTDSTSLFVEADCAPDVFYSVVVDDKLVQKREVTTKGTNYIFIRGLAVGEHNIKIIRDCEGRTDKYFTVKSLQLDGGNLLPKDADKTLIEFLGDSLTSGYGNLVLDGTLDPQELKNQSAMLAYPYLVADKLGLDYRIVSQNGIALDKRDGYVAFPEYYNTENYHLDKTKKYASSNPQDVDIVVVNIGANDMGAGLYDTKNIESVRAYEKKYAELITTIGYRKNAKIIFVSGVWYKDPAIADGGVAKELKLRGYNNVYALQFVTPYQSGGGGHPSKKEHVEIADKIIKFFKDNGII
ncbi:MAG: hypothetical protein IKJ93_06270 [Clostridia bacterium]|nr:hypothetical protein [Clostridia bacterium]